MGDRIGRHGITAEQCAELSALDARILADAPTATAAAVQRLARWLAAAARR